MSFLSLLFPNVHFLEHARILSFHLSRSDSSTYRPKPFHSYFNYIPYVQGSSKQKNGPIMFINVLFVCVCGGEVLLKVVYHYTCVVSCL
jgi:hypothetical protein